jgi:hypothetical protein
VAIQSFNPKEREIYDELKDELANRNDADIWWNWNFGQRVTKVYRTAKKDHKVYNAHFLERLAVALCGAKSDGFLRRAMNVVECWGSKTAFGAIVNMRGPEDNALSWTHIQHLAAVSDPKLREELATKALNDMWSSVELFEAIKVATGGAKGTGGRPVKKPQSVAGCIAHIAGQAAKFVKLYEEAWTGAGFDLLAAIAKLPPAQLNEKLCDEVASTGAVIDELATCVGNLADLLSDAESELRTRLAEQEEQRAAADEPSEGIDVAGEETFVADEDEPDEDESGDPESINMADWRRSQQPPKKRGRRPRSVV